MYEPTYLQTIIYVEAVTANTFFDSDDSPEKFLGDITALREEDINVSAGVVEHLAGLASQQPYNSPLS